MKILDGIVEWIAEQVMNFLDIINSSVLGALGCDMSTFNGYFPAAKTLFDIFMYIGFAIILMNLIWNLYKNYGLGLGAEAEDPIRLTVKSIIFFVITFYSFEIMELILKIGGTPYKWIVDSELPPISFANGYSVLITVIGAVANGSVALIALVIILILAWNYIKLLFEAAERYIVLAVLIYTSPVGFSMGVAKSTSNIFKSWCRMIAGQVFLLILNAWCLKLFTVMFSNFIANPLMW